ncbi:protein BatD [Arachidicoccus ginsenosidivorans]|uniref:Protein BatD n=1 Tax=Arachidicoccus ginsenosidivorans TaxID=496057 RepID=A0A5B8VP67_9BACT|nr:BatD family protein [Arachidicoccus ginsenosidivorans]QEC73023.1 protein BatD [Arachidicoccus ginsenosidivorans]
MFKRTILVIFVLGLMISGLVAQPAVQLHLSDQTIGSKDALQVTYEFKNISQPQMPDVSFADWDVNGPSISQRTSIINGNATSSYSYIYTLYPKHIGTLKVPGITYDYNGKPLVCHDQTVKVVQKEHVKKKQSAGTDPFGSLLQSIPAMPGMGLPSDIFGSPSAPPPPQA